MWAVYFTGCTDSFMHALFNDKDKAITWALANCYFKDKAVGDGKDGDYFLVFYTTPESIPNEDTGWER